MSSWLGTGADSDSRRRPGQERGASCRCATHSIAESIYSFTLTLSSPSITYHPITYRSIIYHSIIYHSTIYYPIGSESIDSNLRIPFVLYFLRSKVLQRHWQSVSTEGKNAAQPFVLPIKVFHPNPISFSPTKALPLPFFPQTHSIPRSKRPNSSLEVGILPFRPSINTENSRRISHLHTPRGSSHQHYPLFLLESFAIRTQQRHHPR